jgi:hypothetical protein
VNVGSSSGAGSTYRSGRRGSGAGRHTVAISYSSDGITPGVVEEAPLPIGPLAVAADVTPRLLNVPRSRAQTLCGRRLDWVEALRR